MPHRAAQRTNAHPRRAKIVATVGPASGDEPMLRQLLEAGVDVVRLNLSHGDHEFHGAILRRVRRIAGELGRFVPVIVDLMGPRYRLSQLEGEPKMLEAGEEVTFGVGEVDLPVEESEFLDSLQVGERVLIDNGLVELEVVQRADRRVLATVVFGGQVSTRKGINLPDTDLPFTISDKDRADIAFAVEHDADFIAVSFVGGPGDLEAIRGVMEEHRGNLPLIAKLERAAVMKRLDPTVQAADAVMVARGDLGVEVPPHRVPVMQKQIISSGRRYGKPVIVATQMLESMMQQPRPTRAETSDVANAVFDGADALMLSGETAAGRFPVEAVGTMCRIIEEAEHYRRPKAYDPKDKPAATHLLPGSSEQPYLNAGRDLHLEIPEVVSAAAVYAVDRIDCKHIVAFSQGGFTARMIARYRPNTPITVFTRNEEVARRVQLVWGARPVLLEYEVNHHDEVVASVDRILVEKQLARPGDTITILMGDPIDQRPLTNLMRVHRVRSG
ncbi:MAG: pyruvate kinase [Thermoanaerobaculia bacterium]|nr:pyruvate kinase [Thermoanaerobaculia bacterium]